MRPRPPAVPTMTLDRYPGLGILHILILSSLFQSHVPSKTTPETDCWREVLHVLALCDKSRLCAAKQLSAVQRSTITSSGVDFVSCPENKDKSSVFSFLVTTRAVVTPEVEASESENTDFTFVSQTAACFSVSVTVSEYREAISRP